MDTRSVPSEMLVYGDIAYNTLTLKATVRNKPVELMRAQRDLLVVMLRNPTKLFTRQEIIDLVGRADRTYSAQSADQIVGRLRRALAGPDILNYIRTVYGLGYQLAPPGKERRFVPQIKSKREPAPAQTQTAPN